MEKINFDQLTTFIKGLDHKRFEYEVWCLQKKDNKLEKAKVNSIHQCLFKRCEFGKYANVVNNRAYSYNYPLKSSALAKKLEDGKKYIAVFLVWVANKGYARGVNYNGVALFEVCEEKEPNWFIPQKYIEEDGMLSMKYLQAPEFDEKKFETILWNNTVWKKHLLRCFFQMTTEFVESGYWEGYIVHACKCGVISSTLLEKILNEVKGNLDEYPCFCNELVQSSALTEEMMKKYNIENIVFAYHNDSTGYEHPAWEHARNYLQEKKRGTKL